MKILYLDHTSEMGGAEHNLLDLVSQFPRDQVQARIATTPDGPLGSYFEQLEIPVSYFSLSSKTQFTSREELQSSLITTALQRIPELWAVRQHLRQILMQHPVQLVQSNSLKSHILASLAVFGTKTPLIWHLQDLITQRGDNRRVLELFARLVKPRIVCISEAVKADLTPFMQTLATVIPNGIATERLRAGVTGKDMRQEFKIPKHAFLVGMVGHLIPWKGHRYLLQAAQQLHAHPRTIYYLCVGGEILQFKGQQAILQQEAKVLGLENNFIFTGIRSDISDVMNSLDLLVLPSENEPFGRVLIEAMTFGKPIIATRGGGVPEIVIHGETGILVPIGDIASLTNGILRFVENSVFATQIGEAGRQRVEQSFTLQAMARKFLELYKEVA